MSESSEAEAALIKAAGYALLDCGRNEMPMVAITTAGPTQDVTLCVFATLVDSEHVRRLMTAIHDGAVAVLETSPMVIIPKVH